MSNFIWNTKELNIRGLKIRKIEAYRFLSLSASLWK